MPPLVGNDAKEMKGLRVIGILLENSAVAILRQLQPAGLVFPDRQGECPGERGGTLGSRVFLANGGEARSGGFRRTIVPIRRRRDLRPRGDHWRMDWAILIGVVIRPSALRCV